MTPHELARVASRTIGDGDYVNGGAGDAVADALWAAGWRKKPSAPELVLVLVETNGLSYGERADAILALMDGPTETGDMK